MPQTFLNKNPRCSLVSDNIDQFLDLGQIKLCWLYVALHDICSLMEFGNQNFTTLVATLRIPNWFPIQYYDVTWIMRFKPWTVYLPGLQLAGCWTLSLFWVGQKPCKTTKLPWTITEQNMTMKIPWKIMEQTITMKSHKANLTKNRKQPKTKKNHETPQNHLEIYGNQQKTMKLL